MLFGRPPNGGASGLPVRQALDLETHRLRGTGRR